MTEQLCTHNKVQSLLVKTHEIIPQHIFELNQVLSKHVLCAMSGSAVLHFPYICLRKNIGSTDYCIQS